MRSAALLLALTCAATSALAEPGSALIHVTEADLNLFLRDAFRAEGGSTVSGARERAGRSMHDLRYAADLSEPVLDLGEAGSATLSLDVLRANVQVGRIEKKLWHRRMTCEDAGVRIEGGHPLGVQLSLRFAVENGGLQLVPEGVRIENAEDLRLDRPARCSNAPLPTWLLWQLGKGRLRRQMGRLDEVILARAQAGAGRLEERGGLLGRGLGLLAGGNLVPTAVETTGGSLLVTLAAPEGATASSPTPTWVGELGGESFLALSESLVNDVVRREFADRREAAKHPTGDLRKLLRSSAVFALAPGLRGMDRDTPLAVSFRLSSPPLVRFDTLHEDEGKSPAVIRVVQDGLEIDLVDLSNSEEPRVVGTIAVSGRLTVLPYANVLGGLSLRPIENEWSVSSSGIEFDDAALEATLQELVFGELFETSFEPVAREARVGNTRLSPRFFSQRGDHLVIALQGGAENVGRITATH